MTEHVIKLHELKFEKKQTIEVPAFSKILDIKTFDDTPHLIVLEDVNEKKYVKRKIRLYQAKANINPEVSYIGTIKDYRGLIFHVFEKWGDIE